MSSQLVAYVCYQMLKRTHNANDVFHLLAVDSSALYLHVSEVLPVLKSMAAQIVKNEADDDRFIHDDMFSNPGDLLVSGIQNLGKFHANRPLKINSDQKIICKDLKLLYYYANRLSGFGFEELIP